MTREQIEAAFDLICEMRSDLMQNVAQFSDEGSDKDKNMLEILDRMKEINTTEMDDLQEIEKIYEDKAESARLKKESDAAQEKVRDAGIALSMRIASQSPKGSTTHQVPTTSPYSATAKNIAGGDDIWQQVGAKSSTLSSNKPISPAIYAADSVPSERDAVICEPCGPVSDFHMFTTTVKKLRGILGMDWAKQTDHIPPSIRTEIPLMAALSASQTKERGGRTCMRLNAWKALGCLQDGCHFDHRCLMCGDKSHGVYYTACTQFTRLRREMEIIQHSDETWDSLLEYGMTNDELMSIIPDSL